MELHLQLGSGPFSEECSELFFYASAVKEHLAYDAKYFNWFRNGVRSPNFRVVQAGEKHESEEIGETDCHSEPPTLTIRVG